MQFESDQARGGRKGGLPISEEIAVLARSGLSAALAGNEKAIPENSGAVNPKHVSAQAAIHVQSAADFCVLPLGI